MVKIEIIVFLISFILLLVLGVPFVFAMILPTFIYLKLVNYSVGVVAMRLFDPISTPTLLAIPLFILTAEILNEVGITDRIFILARKLIGHWKGGLGHVNVIASMIFAGMSGSAIADTAGLGRIEIKSMNDAGYDPYLTWGVTGTSAILGPIIPPSIPLVIYGSIAECSVGRLFMAGIIPGILIAFLLMLTVLYIANTKPGSCPLEPVSSWKDRLIALKNSILALSVPLIIIIGIFSGKFSPTEAAAVAVFVSILLSIIYKKFSFSLLFHAFEKAMKSAAKILFIMAGAFAFSWAVTITGIPKIIVNFLITVTQNSSIILILILLLSLFLGTFLTTSACILILAPIVVPVAQTYGIDLIYFGIFLVYSIMIGTVTPPVGGVLFALSEMTGEDVFIIAKACLPFIIALIMGLFILIFFPRIVTFLPDLMY